MTCVEIDREALAAEVYASSVRYAMSLARKMGWEMEEAAINAATDAVLWCLGRAEEVKDWPAFVRGNVKKAVERAKQKLWDKRSGRGETRDQGDGPNDDEPFDLDKLPAKPYTSPEGRLDCELADTLATRDDEDGCFDRSRTAWEQREAVASLYHIDGMSLDRIASRLMIPKRLCRNRLREFHTLDPDEIGKPGPPPILATAVQLYYIYQKDEREAAEALGVSKGTFKNLLDEASHKVGRGRPLGPRGNMKKKFKR